MVVITPMVAGLRGGNPEGRLSQRTRKTRERRANMRDKNINPYHLPED